MGQAKSTQEKILKGKLWKITLFQLTITMFSVIAISQLT